jgi:hypothetical protein
MRHTFFAAVAACALAAGPAYAQRKPPDPSQPNYVASVGSAAQLDALDAEWDRIGFSPPSKPGQFRVYGRDGHVTDGPGFNTMVSLIRSAAIDSLQGREQEAFAKIAIVRRLLGPASQE